MADFVKIGSPAGIIVREGEIKVLKPSLPLGYSGNLRPTVCTRTAQRGRHCGVYVRRYNFRIPLRLRNCTNTCKGLKPLNPQNLQTLLNAAKERAKSVTDDMTVLCTRIFKSSQGIIDVHRQKTDR